MLEQALIHAFADAGVQAPVATVLTQVVVNPADPAFQHPTKPVGPFYTAEQAQQRARDKGWTVVEDAARGWRRVVPSPEPREIVEIDAIRDLARPAMWSSLLAAAAFLWCAAAVSWLASRQ